MSRRAIAAVVFALGFAAPAVAARAEAPVDACMQSDHAPAPPAPPIARVVGQYGTGDSILDISEHCGRLYASGRGFKMTALERAGSDQWRLSDRSITVEPRTFVFDPGLYIGARWLRLGDEQLPRIDVGAVVEDLIHGAVHADPDKVRKAALAATPPKEPAPERTSDLVPLTSIDPTIKVDTIYASTRNFMGIPIYEKAGAYMQRPAAEAVARASKELHKYGYGLRVTDAYRPWYATKMFWDATPPEDHNFVADPAQGSRHNRGCAVDLTLYDLKTGEPVEMTGRIDEMSARSIANYDGGTTRQRWFRALLRREMEAQGFTVYTDEWWHFDYKDWADYGIGTATYTELDAGRAR